MTTFNTKSSGIPSEAWFQKQNYETLSKIAELLYRTHKIKLDDDGWSEMTEDKVSERCHEWGIEDGTNMWHSINRLRNANGLPSWEDGDDEEEEQDDEEHEDDDEHEEEEHDEEHEDDDEHEEEEHDEDSDEDDDEHEEEEHDEDSDEELKAPCANNTLLEAWQSAGMRATVIRRYEDGSCDISMKSPLSGATVSARVPHSFLVSLNAE